MLPRRLVPLSPTNLPPTKVDDYPDARTVPGLVIYRYDSPLFFANAEDFRVKALGAVAEFEAQGEVYWLLLNMEANVEVDIREPSDDDRQDVDANLDVFGLGGTHAGGAGAAGQ